MTTPAVKLSATPAVKSAKGSLPMYDPWDLHVVGLDDEAGEEAALYDPRVHDDIPEPFIDSIAADGVLEPVEVVAADDCRVVFGRKRVAAARIASLPVSEGGRGKKVLVPVMFSPEGLTLAEQESRVFTENVQRVDDNPLVLADKVAAFLKRNGDSKATRKLVAVSLGLRAAQVKSLLQLRSVDERVKRRITKGELGVYAALKIAKLPSGVQEKVTKRAEELSSERKEKEQRRRAKKKGVAVEDAADVVEVKNKGRGGKDIADRDVQHAIAEHRGSKFPRPGAQEIREVLELLRENSILDSEVSNEAVLEWVVGDVACPWDLTALDMDEE